MELQEKLDSLDKRVRRQSRLLALAGGLLLLTIGFLITRWVLGVEGRLDLQGNRVYVHRGGGSLVTTSIHPRGLEAHSFETGTEAYGKHVVLGVSSEKTRLQLSANSAERSTDLELFVTPNRSGLSIQDSKQKGRINLFVSEDGPKLQLLDETGKVLFEAPQ